MGPIERPCAVAVLIAAVALLLAVQSSAALRIYEDREAWEAALRCPVYTEDFESDALG
jgi:hypothetical protein